MGILNVTPDSFSDGGLHSDPDRALAHAELMIAEGADILDVGGESTRPGSLTVPESEQINRIVPVIREIRKFWNGPISVDTTRAAVVEAAFDSGANWINDISALRDDPRMIDLAVAWSCPIVLMHMLGTPRTMQENPAYVDIVKHVKSFLRDRAQYAIESGVLSQNIILDPGIGFGKTVDHNVALIKHLAELVELGYPVLVGASRKSFIGHLTGASVDERLAGSLAAAIRSVGAGAKIVRVHDVGATRQALAVASAISPQ
jgi:dihydropteroate synthase